MNRIVAVILICLLVAPPAWAGQKPGAALDWEKVTGLKAGTDITLTVTNSQPSKVKLLFADESLLVTLMPTDPKLPGNVKRVLLEVSDNWPVILNRAGSFARNDVRVSPDGIFDHDEKVAELAVIQQTPREDIVEIRGPVERRGSASKVAIFAGGGFLLGALLAVGLANKECGASCSDEKVLMGLSLIGLPAGLGFLGYYTGHHTVEGVVYRVPQPTQVGLDEATWHRLRETLPRSLRGPGAR